MAHWMNLGQQFKVNARRYARKLALKDQRRSYTYAEANQRVNQLAHGLKGLGLSRGDKIAVFMDNCIEIIELYLATAKTGIIIVPINFRLVGPEVEYIVNNADAKAMVVQDQLTDVIDPIKSRLSNIPANHYVAVGSEVQGYMAYEKFIAGNMDDEPDDTVAPSDTWILMYTSGTTGKPKGVIRSHESHISFYLINGLDMGFNNSDYCMNVMPLCHINSTFYTFLFLYLGGSVYVHPALAFRAPEVLRIVEAERITFISLIPTHYNLILNVDEENRRRDVGSIRKLLCSSAPVRRKMKREIMDFFPNAELYEGYGSTEAGSVTVLQPEDQMVKTGSIGRELLGTDFIKILDKQGKEVPAGEVGEIYSCGPTLFDEYYKLPEKTAASFKDGWFSAGDMGMRDEDGYYYIVDRKDNMIITGGENVYPSEVEEAIGSHECVFDCACIGLPDEKWGEKIVAVVTLKEGVDENSVNAADIQSCCQEKLAGYKRPKEIIFIKGNEMPRTTTGKILHRKLKDRYTN
ncbi:AMP-dependent synthetase and ligase [Desulfosarcina cetonica]|uniref:class I adenylate-forming enzyme family protein n=1 Tax=Desulfosarcina cetonica TaxID=90730 RepID=UPI0006D23FAD|nr:AMP-binding protein [Desulfosarcina cetonica]VTR70400.1 AMP-dependent synthetase and ligase [Desulfosarcina cetonica]